MDPCSKVVQEKKDHRRRPHALQKKQSPGQASKAWVDVDDDDDDDESGDNLPYAAQVARQCPSTLQKKLSPAELSMALDDDDNESDDIIPGAGFIYFLTLCLQRFTCLFISL